MRQGLSNKDVCLLPADIKISQRRRKVRSPGRVGLIVGILMAGMMVFASLLFVMSSGVAFAATWGPTSITDTNNDGYEAETTSTWYASTQPYNYNYIGRDAANGHGQMNIGLRFTNITIPQGATINSATIEVYSAATDILGTPTGQWQAWNTDNAGQFGGANRPSTVPLTTAYVTHNPSTGAGWKSASIGSVIQEIINRSGWASGNAINLVWMTTNTSDAYQDFNDVRQGSNPARLTIDYTVPQGSSIIKSVQRGSQAMTATPTTLTIGSVVPANSFVICDFRPSTSGQITKYPTCELTDATHLVITTGVADAATVVNWQVVEFTSGVSVQRGSQAFLSTDTTINVGITAVDTSKTFVLVRSRCATSSTGIDEEVTVRARLTSATNLELSRNESGVAINVAWQVVQMDGASVQSNITTIGAGSTTATVTISPVDTTKTFLVFNTRAAGASNGIEGQYLVRGTVTDPTTLTFNRNTTSNSVDISWFAVTMDDGTTVQKGSLTNTTTETTRDVTISSINTTTSMSIVSSDGGSDTANNMLDDSSWTSRFTSATNLRFERASALDFDTDIDWFVVQFSPPAQMGATLVTSIAEQADQLTYDFPSATYSNSVLYIAYTATSCAADPTDCGLGIAVAPKVASVSGAGLTFTEIGTPGGVTFSTVARRIQAWRALVTSGATTGPVTITLEAGALFASSMGGVILEFTGTKTSGTNGADAVVQWPTATGGGSVTSLTVTMGAFANSNNRPVAFFAHREEEETTPEAGYTELWDGQHPSVVMGYMAEWQPATAETSPSASWASSVNAGGFALEIAAAVPPTTNYRSIGTNTGTLYNTGNASINSGTTTVTFGGGASLPVPTAVGAVGPGDSLVIGSETFYILSRDDNTHVTVQTTATSTHTNESYTITRAYNDIQIWENDRDGNLVGENRTEVGVAYKDGVFMPTARIVIDGSTTDAFHYMSLTVPPGQRHNGTAGTGVIADGTNIVNVANAHMFFVRDPYFRMEWLEIRNYFYGVAAPGQPINLDETFAGDNLFSHLIIHNFSSWDGATAYRGAFNVYESATIRNCIIYNGDVGIRTYSNTNLTLTLQNTTIYNAGIGLNHTAGNLIINNTILVGNATRDLDLDNGQPIDPSSGYNMYSTSAGGIPPGTNNQSPPASLEDLFVSIVSGAENLHVEPSGHTALNNGIELSASYTDDIDGQTRPQGAGTWDIGADEYMVGPPTTVYRSIGTNTGTLYNTGNASINIGTTTVTFGGGASLPVPTAIGAVGPGDRLVIGSETFYILSRDDDTHVTVQTAATSTHTNESYTITRTYNTLQAWEDDRDGDLVTRNTVEVGVAYNDGIFTAGVTIDGSTTDSTRYMWLTVADGQRHTGTAGTGVKIDPATAGHVMTIRNSYTIVDGFEITGYSADSQYHSGVEIDGVATSNVAVRRNLIHDDLFFGLSQGINDGETGGGHSIYNNIVYGGSQTSAMSTGIRCYWSTTSKVYNNTVYKATNGISTSHTGNVVDARNNLVIGCTADFVAADSGSWGANSDYNASSDTSSPGSNSLDNVTAANNFVNTTAGSEDLHLKSGANAIDAGTDLSSSFNTDIDGQSRTAPWDIGADEYVPGPTLTLANHASGQVGDKFTTSSPVTDVLYRFKLTSTGTVTVDTMRVNFTTTGGVANNDVTDGELWVDVDNDGVIDSPGDTQIQAGVTPSGGVLTFTNNFAPSPSGTNYLVRATVFNLAGGDTTTFSVGTADIDEVEVGITESGSINDATHTQDADALPWWNSSYGARMKITVIAGSVALPNGYSVTFTFNHASLVSGGKSQADGDDVRVVRWNGSGWDELDRSLDEFSSWNNASTMIWFRTQAAINAGGSDDSYYLYYWNPSAVSPPANKANVFDMWDDFLSGGDPPTGWTEWQDDSDLQPQPVISSISGGILTINSGGGLVGGIRHNTYNPGNTYGFAARTRTQSVAVVTDDLAPVCWFINDPDGETYCYETRGNPARNRYVRKLAGGPGADTLVQEDITTGPFPAADTWYIYEVQRLTSGTMRALRNNSQQFPPGSGWSTADTNIVSGDFGLGGESAAGEDYQFDWIWARKLVDSEPTNSPDPEEYPPGLTLANHASGQVADKFIATSPVTDVLYSFKLSRMGTVTVDTLRVNFTLTGGVANNDVTNGELWVDNNNDGAIGAGDTLIQGSVMPSGGVLTFTTNFTPSTSGTNYLVRATVSNLVGGDTTTFSVTAAEIDEVETGVSESGSITDATHTQDTPAILDQIHYRWRNDDGGESTINNTTQVSATADTTTTSTTDVLVDSMTITPGAGDYLVWFSGSVECNTITTNQYVSIYVNGAQLAHTERQITTEESIPNSSFPVATHARVTGVTAGQAIDVRWRTTGGTATMHERTLVVTRIVAADSTQASATADATTTSTTDVLVNAMTITPGAGDYHIWFSGSVEAAATSYQYVSLYVNGVQLAHTERQIRTEGSIPATSFPVATHARVTGVTAGQAIEVRWRTSASTATMHERTLVVGKITPANSSQASATADTTNLTQAIKIQRGTANVPVGGTTQAPPTAFGSLTSAFVLNKNNRFGSAGRSTQYATNVFVDDVSLRIALTGTNTITFTRIAGSDNANYRADWESWEYVGASGGPNEFIVRSRNTVTLAAGFRTATATLSNTPVSINKCIPFITGISNTDTGTTSQGLTALAWISGTNTLNVERGGNVGSTVVQVVTVEFTGSNWRVGHGRTADTTLDTGTVTLYANANGTSTAFTLNNINNAIIASAQFKADDTAANDNIADTYPAMYISSTTQVTWVFHADHVGADNQIFVHVLENAGMSVTRYTNTGSSAGDNNVDITSAGVTDLANTAIFGTRQSSGTGTAFPIGWTNYRITSTTNAALWCTRSGNTVESRIEIAKMPMDAAGSDVLVDSMTIIPGAGDYQVWFSGSAENSAASSTYVSLYVNGAQLPHTERQIDVDSSIPDTAFPVATHAYVTGVGAGQAIEVRWRASAGTATMHERTLVVEKDSTTLGATWAANEDIKLTGLAKSTLKRIRLEVSNGGSQSSGGVAYQLQVAQTSTCSSGTYIPVPTGTSGHWQIVGSSYITDGEATSNIASGLTDGATTFVPGQLKDADNTTASITLISDSFTEIEFAVQATANAIDGANYCFRLYNTTAGADLNAYSKYAEVTLAGLAVTLSEASTGQITDQFDSSASLSDALLYRLRLYNNSASPATVDRVVLHLTGISGIVASDLSDLRIRVGSGPTGATLSSAPTVNITGNTGTITFDGDFSLAGSFGTNLFVSGDVINLVNPDTLTISLALTDVTLVSGSIIGTAPSDVNHRTDPLPYEYRRMITINVSQRGSTCTGSLSNYPVLISLSGNWLKTRANGGNVYHSEGYDIVFRDANLIPLNHEIEMYDGSGGALVAWVKIPVLFQNNQNTIIYMDYGSASVTSPTENPAGVWDSNYVGVWHLDESGTGAADEYKDSTQYANDGQGGTAPARESAKIGRGQHFDGTDNGIMIDADPELNITGTITVEAWVELDSSLPPQKAGIVGKGIQYHLYHDASASQYVTFDADALEGPASPTANLPQLTTWYHIVGVVDATETRIYRNGVLQETDPNGGALWEDTDALWVTIGLWTDTWYQTFDGLIDEVRISNLARDACWIGTNYNNQNEPGSFATVGDEIVLGEFENRKQITLNVSQRGSSCSGSLSNFPVLISLSGDWLKTKANGGSIYSYNGYDIIFRASDGKTQLDHEVETYDGSAGTLVAWVRIPILFENDQDTIIYIYYGNAYITSPTANPTGVWETGYKGVWHLKESGNGTADEYTDSTQYTNHGQGGEGNSLFVPTRTAGKISYGQDFNNSDGKYDLIDCGNDSSLDITGDQITLEAWVRHDTSVEREYGILNHKGWNSGYSLWMQGDHFQCPSGQARCVQFNLPGSTHSLRTQTTLTGSAWHHVVGTYDGASMKVFIDGVQDSNTVSKTGNITAPSPPENEVWIGHGDQPKDVGWSAEWLGQIDEVRISNTARSACWVETEYNNQSSPAAFSSVGSGEDLAYKYRKRITILDSMTPVGCSGNLSNFPVLINLSGNWLKTEANGGDISNPNGYDIIFKASDDVTQLDHEIEKYDGSAAGGTLIAWVRIPTLLYNADTVIYMYYGNGTVTSPTANPAGVWDSNYKGVWHLAETAGTTNFDSTSNVNNGTKVSATEPNPTAAKIGSGQNFDVVDDKVTITNLTSEPAQATYSAWIKPNSGGELPGCSAIGCGRIFDKRTAGAEVLNWYVEGDTNYRMTLNRQFSGGQGSWNTPSTSIMPGNQYYVVVTYDSSSAANDPLMYINGQPVTVTENTTPSGSPNSNTDPYVIGNRGGQDRTFDGWIDEFRISNTFRSACWVGTEYNNQDSPLGYIDVEGQEDLNYKHQKQITLLDSMTPASCSSNLSNFPVLISLSGNWLKTEANGGDVSNANGYDIIFKAQDGETKLDHEIEKYDGTAGTLLAWVRIPTLLYNGNTIIYMYYGNSAVTTPQANPAGVWNTGYGWTGVWHLKEDPSVGAPQMKDSTSNANHGTSGGSWPSGDQVTGKIDGSLDFDAGDYISMGDPSSLDMGTSDFTIETWVRLDSSATQEGETIIWKGAGSTSNAGYWLFWYNMFDYIRFTISNGDGVTSRPQVNSTNISSIIEDGLWHHVVAVADRGGNGSIYFDGQLNNSADWSSYAGSINTATDFALNVSTAQWTLAGGLDEVRIAAVARDACWIGTSYNNQYSPSATYVVGGDESGYRYRKQITISDSMTPAGCSSNLSNFPLVISLSGDWLKTEANGGNISNPNGYDIIFKASDDVTQLDHEIEKYDGVNGALVAWIRIPTLVYNGSTSIYMHYGNLAITSPTANPAGVWDSNYKGVWHLQETSGQYLDSTGNNNAGTAAVTSRTATAKIGTNAPQFNSTTNNNINCGTGSSLDFSGNMTLEAWIYPTDWGEGGFGAIVERGAEPSDGYEFYIRQASTSLAIYDGASLAGNVGSITLGTWQHVVAVVSGGNTASFYVNGVGAGSGSWDFAAGGSATFYIGTFSDMLDTFGGTIDEVRASNVSRSACWIGTGYNNQNSPAAYISVEGDESAYRYRKQITILDSMTPASCSGNLSNYPALISLSGDWLKTEANGGNISNPNGYDIIFKAQDDVTKLDHEIEKYDGTSTGGTLVAWVRIPTLVYNGSTSIYMYYGNATITSATENPTGVWDSDFKAVYHLKETSGNQNDSTSNGNHLTTVSVTNQGSATGKMNGADQFNGSTDYAQTNTTSAFDVASGNSMTIEAWVRTSSSDGFVVNRKDGDGVPNWQVYMTGGRIEFRLSDNSGNSVFPTSSGTVNNDQLHYIVGRWDGGSKTGEIIIDNLTPVSSTNGSVGANTATRSLVIGREGDDSPGYYFNGIIDEVRFSSTPRNNCWIGTTYNNQDSPATYMNVGGEEDLTFNYQKQITISDSMTPASCSGDLTNFPVLISLSGYWLKTEANGGDISNPNGYDIVFKAQDGATKLDHEIEKYDGSATGGTLVAWVRIPTLFYNESTIIYMYYGNSTITSPTANPAGVWSNAYRGVWHLKEDPGPGGAGDIKDSTANSNHGTAAASMLPGDQVSGQIDGSLHFDGVDDWVNAGGATSTSLDNLTTMTMEAWIKPATWGEDPIYGYGRIFDKDARKIYLVATENGLVNTMKFLQNFSGIDSVWFAPTNALSLNSWAHVAVTYDNGSISNVPTFYVNGQPLTTTKDPDFAGGPTGTADSDATFDLYIGNSSLADRTFDGIIDEARYSSVIRDACWIGTSYNNQSSPGMYISVEGEEFLGYQYREQITITAPAGKAVPSDYPIKLTFDHASLVAAGNSQADGDDIRVIYWNGTSWVELARILFNDKINSSSWNSSNTQILFKTQAQIPAGASSTSYYLLYGNPSAVNPPTNTPSSRYYRAQSLGVTVNSSTTYANKVQLQFTPSSSSEHWVVVATWRSRGDPAQSATAWYTGHGRVSLNGTPRTGTDAINYRMARGVWKTFNVVLKITGTTAQQTVGIDFAANSDGDADEIDNARILAFLIPNPSNADIRYSETLARTTDIGATNAQTLTFTPSSAGDYIWMANSFHHEGPGSAGNGIFARDDTATDQQCSWESYIPDTEGFVPMVHFERRNLTATSKTFTIYHNASATPGSERQGLTQLLFRTDVFDAVEVADAASETSTTQTTYQPKNSLTTASVGIPYDYVYLAVMAMTNGTVNDDTLSTFGEIRLNSVQQLEEEVAIARDISYYRQMAWAHAETTTGNRTIDSRYKAESGQTTYARYAHILSLRYIEPNTIVGTQEQATAVKLASFTATQNGSSVLLSWKTGHEVDNLGFHIYREENGQLVRLTPEPVAGSALLAGSSIALKAGHHYTWWDFPTLATRASSPATSTYWLEDIDLSGKRTMHGPVMPVLSGEASLEKMNSELLSELGMKLEQRYQNYWRARELKEKLKTKNVNRYTLLGNTNNLKTNNDSRITNNKAAFLASPAGTLLKARKASALSSRREGDRLMQQYLASRPAVKILVNEEGWYRVNQPELVAAGLNSNANPQYLQLFVDGRELPIRVIGDKDGRVDPSDAVEFYGIGLDTPSTDTRVYWLVEGLRPGKRMNESGGLGGSASPASFPYTVEKKDRLIYFPAIRNGDLENFFGSLVYVGQVHQLLETWNLDQAAPENALLEIVLQGGTEGTHRVKVYLNTVEVGELVFVGQAKGTLSTEVPQSLLLEGENLLTLEVQAQGEELDVSVIDTIRLTYWHTYTAENDFLKFTAPGGSYLYVDSFSHSGIRVVDITEPGTPIEVVGKVEPQQGSYAIGFRVPGSGLRTLMAFTEGRIKNPLGAFSNLPSSWHKASNGEDMVMVAHRDFLLSLKFLKTLRESQGLSVALIDIEDIYDEFSFGHKSPKAIRDFLSHAKSKWKKSPRYVLLVGDASLDPRNYLGYGDFDFVPTKLIDTLYAEAASDDWFVDFNDDGLPEMAIGRLPVRTPEETSIIASKIMGYERSGTQRVALLVADMKEQGDDFDFEAASNEVMDLLPSSMMVRKIYRSQFGSDAQAKGALLGGINEGSLLVNFIGHGSNDTWRGIFGSGDVESLTNRGLPFFINMTCKNGAFHDPNIESLAEALIKASGGGAVAVWTSSGLTGPSGQLLMNKELIKLLFNGEPMTFGDAISRAKAATFDQDVRKTWILFGDPATGLQNRGHRRIGARP